MLLMKFLFLNNRFQIILKSKLTQILESRYGPSQDLGAFQIIKI